MLLIPNPNVDRGEGYYGPIQESLIEFVGGVAGVIMKTPASRHYVVAIIAGGINISCDIALMLDDKKEQDFIKTVSSMTDLYSSSPNGVIYYF
ncbi:MAG: hypothetical protein [Circoviridae sp.]|nr:MAG: hypothetical protein [Circoviridae sp.]